MVDCCHQLTRIQVGSWNFDASCVSSKKTAAENNRGSGSHVVMVSQGDANGEYMLGPELGAIIVSQYEGGTDEHGWWGPRRGSYLNSLNMLFRYQLNSTR